MYTLQEGTSYTITDHVNQLHSALCPEPRTLQLFTSLINHLHAFARETKPTHEEWTTAIKYLTRAGKESTEFKNEFILLSDCLGLSALLDELSHPKPDVRCTLRVLYATHSSIHRDARRAASQGRSTLQMHQKYRPGPRLQARIPSVSLCSSRRRSRIPRARASRAPRPRW